MTADPRISPTVMGGQSLSDVLSYIRLSPTPELVHSNHALGRSYLVLLYPPPTKNLARMLGLPDEILLSIFFEVEPLDVLPFRRVLCPICQQLPYNNGCISRFVNGGDVSLTLLQPYNFKSNAV